MINPIQSAPQARKKLGFFIYFGPPEAKILGYFPPNLRGQGGKLKSSSPPVRGGKNHP